ncbi:MAG: transposase [Gammaproteobacteria bacterium]|nr:transposase [Gammaproteobacteria bacterium]
MEKADQCTGFGEIGALLRREGLYSSHLSTWRQLRRNGVLKGLAPHKRGPKGNPNAAQLREIATLQKQVNRLQGELSKARTIIDVQKKLSTILTTIPNDEDKS